MILFSCASLLPYACLFAAMIWGGPWAWLALISITGWVLGMDRLLPKNRANPDPQTEFPAAVPLLVALGIGHIVLLIALMFSVAPGRDLSTGTKILIVMVAGLIFGQISHPTAHELIHKPSRWLRLLGRLMYSTNLVGHHASAHLRVHHVHVASDQDPNSARAGESFYRFAIRATRGSFLAGLAAENRLRAGKNMPLYTHPYSLYIGVGVMTVLLAALIGGGVGLLAVVYAALHAQMQILLSDYVQHYGLRRAQLPTGGLEPVGPQHSWNASERYSSAMMLNAPRHSDHHVKPSRIYPALHLDPDSMPELPRSLPAMAMIAMLPRRWRRIMDPRVAAWRQRFHPKEVS